MSKALGDFIQNEWYFFFPLLFMSMTGLTLILWRKMLNMGAKTNLATFLPVFQAVLQKDGIEGARNFCAMQGGLIPRKLFVAGLDNAKQGAAAMRRSMANVIELEILPEMNFLLPPMLGIAKIATMVGLLLTVVSMIETFSAIGEATAKGEQGAAAQSSGKIGLALFATAMGLITAIPLVFTHVMYKAGIHKFELNMKSAGQKLITLVQNYKDNPQPVAAPVAGAAVAVAVPGAPTAVKGKPPEAAVAAKRV
jgi:biopolymer transport protein ExbB